MDNSSGAIWGLLNMVFSCQFFMKSQAPLPHRAEKEDHNNKSNIRKQILCLNMMKKLETTATHMLRIKRQEQGYL
jgi:hypothetical protein